MIVCSTCDCHVHWRELVCPFCGTERETEPAPMRGAAGVAADALVAITALGTSGRAATA